jgi:hypothetical protein
MTKRGSQGDDLLEIARRYELSNQALIEGNPFAAALQAAIMASLARQAAGVEATTEAGRRFDQKVRTFVDSGRNEVDDS